MEQQQQVGETRVCRECGCTWVYTAREREFMEAKNFVTPLRCMDCRFKRRQAERLQRDDRLQNQFE